MNHDVPAYGLGSLVIINAAVFIVFAFSFFKPKTPRDWRTFGTFSAFIVALFVEMYGFPLTIYLMSGWLARRFPGVDPLSHDFGHLWYSLLSFKGNPHLNPIHILSNVAIAAGFIMLSSAWRVLFQAQKEGRLATSGPYAHVRHPQYVAFIVIMFGFLLQWPTLVTLVMFPVLVAVQRLARREERDVRVQFGAVWDAYARRTPAFYSKTPASSAGGSAACVVVEATMDTSVALVQAYLHVNGYFTVAEYPVLEAFRGEHARSVTDLDILAFRFAGAGHDVIRGRAHRPLGGRALATDPVLGCPADRPDMIVGEVKEGAARFNPAMRDPVVLEVALSRFGCCPAEHAPSLTRELLAQGHVTTPTGHSIRMVAFGDIPDGARQGPWTTVPMRHVVLFLRGYLREHWAVLRHAPIRDPVLGVLALIEKWGVDAQASPEPVTQQVKRERIRGRTLRGQDAHPRRTV